VPAASSDTKDLVSEHAPYLWRALRHLGVRDADIEDACQDVFLVLHRRFSDFRGDSSIKTWLYGICVRVASEYRRRAHVVHEISGEDPPTEVQQADQFEKTARRESLDQLASILDQLDGEKRAVFVLYELEELSMTDVAKAVGCPLQTAYSRLHAARKIVSKAVEKLKHEGGHAT
jgi:RNA polymerase sigma-70 factor, ECF subfamily